jgi:dTDP-4-amino-4,6-dideoxygalactose transaminase
VAVSSPHAGAPGGAAAARPGGQTVPFVALERQHAPLADELEAAFRRVVGASAFTLGTEVEAFEADFASFCTARHAVGVASGTAAISIALRAAGVLPGDEVIVPAHTFIASALGVVLAGATPVFADVEEETGLLDPAAASAAVGTRTAAVLGVHLHGQACDGDALRALTRRHGLLFVEDAAQAHGATWRGRPVGTLGDAACFSFYPSKNLGALGDGGAVVTADGGIAERARMLRNLGQRAKGEHAMLGDNLRLHALQAALLRVKLPHLADWNAARRRHAARYRRLLPEAMRPPLERPASPSVHHLFAVRVAERDAVAARLRELGVHTGVHYHPAMHEQPPFRSAPRAGGALRHAEEWAAQTLSLPMFAELEPHEIEHVGEACRRVLG